MHASPAGDPRFYARSGPFNVAEVALAAGGTAGGVNGEGAELLLSGVAALDSAGPGEVSFLHDRRYAAALAATQAGAVVVHPDMADQVPGTAVAILAPATYEGWARVARLFHPLPPLNPGVHPLALVDPGAAVDPTAEIGPFCCVESGATIGPRTRIGPYASIGEGVAIGADCRIGAHASLSHAILADRVVLHPGVRIGQEGFSFAHTKTGFLTIPQLGRVLIQDDVEIGANTTIDRGSVQNTEIGAGTRIDNLVQIGHNVRIGRCCVIVAQVGISGSTILEDFVQVGGQAAFTGHVRIGKGAQVGAQAGVIGNVAPGAIVLGSPAQPRHEFFRGVATLKRLARPAR
jgi:UDP-3-O-[3-hydroxymyristoyl] glucosamine N-acyltransferase